MATREIGTTLGSTSEVGSATSLGLGGLSQQLLVPIGNWAPLQLVL